MKNKFVFCLLSFIAAVFSPLNANVITGVAAIPDEYYDEVEGKKGADNILDALNTCISRNYQAISYGGLEPHYLKTDFYADTLWDMYSTCRFTYADANKPQSAVCDGWNKEHVVCQSWLGSGPMVSDLFNVYPTDARINNLRSNNVYGVVTGNFSGFSKDPEHHGLGKLGSGTSGAGTVYEPDDQYKGDFARTFFYMVARYRDNSLNGSDGAKMFTSNPTNLTNYSLSFLLDWHHNDPVSEKEIDRNQAVYGEQNNRNPFIDYPELVEYIWGDSIGKTVVLSAMKPTCEGGGSPTPKPKYGVTWSVNGEMVQVDSIIENKRIQELPTTPVPESTTSESFVGWTNAPIVGTTDIAPEILYTKVMEFPVVTADITYYAVFAHGETSSGLEPATYVFDMEKQDGWTTTAAKNGDYLLLDQGKTLVSPDIELAGLSSIKVKMRTYGGSQYDLLDVKAGETLLAQLKAANGKTLADVEWTNTGTLTGRSALTFSSNYGSGKGVGVSAVIINATGTGTVYTMYVTHYGESDIPSTATNEVARKVMRNGQLFILMNNQLYSITGQKIQ